MDKKEKMKNYKKYFWKQYGGFVKISGLEAPIEVPYHDNKLINWIITRFKPKQYTTMSRMIKKQQQAGASYLDDILRREFFEKKD